MCPDLMERPTISGMLIDGFNAIKLITLCKYELGEATDISQLLCTLQIRIKECLGYDYPLASLMDTYDLWVEANK